MDIIPDKYERAARILPAILASLPFFVLYFFFLRTSIGDFLHLIFGLKFIGDLTVGVVLLLLLAFVGRSISKDVFEASWFKTDESQMPSTTFLLHNDGEYSRSFKSRIHKKIENDFQITVFSEKEEFCDETKARKIIAESVMLIRHRVKNGNLILKRNIEYGFIRNFVGCSVIALFVSLFNVVTFYFINPSEAAFALSIVMVVFYLLPILFSKKLINSHGKRYAKALFQEYMTEISI